MHLLIQIHSSNRGAGGPYRRRRRTLPAAAALALGDPTGGGAGPYHRRCRCWGPYRRRRRWGTLPAAAAPALGDPTGALRLISLVKIRNSQKQGKNNKEFMFLGNFLFFIFSHYCIIFHYRAANDMMSNNETHTHTILAQVVRTAP